MLYIFYTPQTVLCCGNSAGERTMGWLRVGSKSGYNRAFEAYVR